MRHYHLMPWQVGRLRPVELQAVLDDLAERSRAASEVMHPLDQ